MKMMKVICDNCNQEIPEGKSIQEIRVAKPGDNQGQKRDYDVIAFLGRDNPKPRTKVFEKDPAPTTGWCKLDLCLKCTGTYLSKTLSDLGFTVTRKSRK
jgi:hypothetical protein